MRLAIAVALYMLNGPGDILREFLATL